MSSNPPLAKPETRPETKAKKVVALHRIEGHDGKGIVVTDAGQLFSVGVAQYAELDALGAIRDATKEDELRATGTAEHAAD